MLPLPVIGSIFWDHKPTFDLLMLLPESDTARLCFYAFYVLSCFCVTIGLFTRFSSIGAFICLFTLHNHNVLNIDGGDDLMRLTCLWLCFTSSGAAFSVDNLIRTWRSNEPTLVLPKRTFEIWAMRMIQLQLCILYLHTFYSKIQAREWQIGLSVYRMTRRVSISRFPMPFFMDYPIVYTMLTYFTLYVEFALFSLIWFKRIRYWVILSGIALHLGIEWCGNFPGFELLPIAIFVTFVDPDDLRRSMDWLKHSITARFGPPSVIYYDNRSLLGIKFARLLTQLDIFGRLTLQPRYEENVDVQPQSHLIDTPDGVLSRKGAWSFFSARLPALWVTWPLAKANQLFAFLTKPDSEQPNFALGLTITILVIAGLYCSAQATQPYVDKAEQMMVQGGAAQLRAALDAQEQQLNEQLTKNPDVDTTVELEERLADVLWKKTKWNEAEKLFQHCWSVRMKQKDPYNEKFSQLLAKMASFYRDWGYQGVALNISQGLLDYDRKYFPPYDEHIIRDLNNVGMQLYLVGMTQNPDARMQSWASSQSYLNEAIACEQHVYGSLGSPQEAISLNNLALTVRDLGLQKEAETTRDKARRMDAQIARPSQMP
jgi:tetratricopeptide (TPR) repeat protein